MELVVLSGKGGTGKTTIAAALSELSKCDVKVDCDVDAPNLHLLYRGIDISSSNFYGTKKAFIDTEICMKCGKCQEYCRAGAIKDSKVIAYKCEGCGTCVLVCPKKAVCLKEVKSADIFITKADTGIISRAEMEIGSAGSGKLIMILRGNGRRYAKSDSLTIIDGPPGIGCPVISSIPGSDAVLLVAEPTKSGLEDFIRAAALCEHFKILAMVCINKYDLNEKLTDEIERFSREKGYKVVGKIPYDDMVMKSINEMKPITCYEESEANKSIRKMWDTMFDYFKNLNLS